MQKGSFSMSQTYGFNVLDYDREQSDWGFNVPVILEDGTNLDDVLTAARDVFDKAKEICLFTDYKTRHLNITTRGDQSASTNPLCQRENKWLVTYEDITEFLDAGNTIPNPGYRKLFSLEVPCADLSIREDNSEVIYTEAGGGVNADVANFVTSLEAAARSPYTGAINVLQIHSVGRNL